jgi:ASC-1-like (ASCH) protein
MSDILVKPIKNPADSPYFDWIKSGVKTYEGRLQNKIQEWNLKLGQKIKFYDQDNERSYVIVEVISLKLFFDFGSAFDALGSKLIPYSTREEVIDLYNCLFHYKHEQLQKAITSMMIQDYGVVAIGFRILEQHD